MSRNEAEQALAPASSRAGGETITREFDRLEALKSIAAEVKANQKPKAGRTSTAHLKD